MRTLTKNYRQLKWDNESDEEENSEQIEKRNRMSYNAKIKKMMEKKT